MKYSIIIPVYNGEKYIEESIESVLKQKVTDFEIIIIDDGSNDATSIILRKYRSYLNINIVTQSNSGVYLARKNGIKHAQGKYCIFLDADDYWEPNTLEEIDMYLKKNEVDLIIF